MASEAASAKMAEVPPPEGSGFKVGKAFDLVIAGAGKRTVKLLSGPFVKLFALQHLLQQLPGSAAEYVSLNGSDPNYRQFVAGPVPEEPPSDENKIKADINNFVSTSMQYTMWQSRAREIRKTGIRSECVGNLSIALDVGAAYSAGMSSSNTLLSLIPTAGVLIGAPAKELWVLYKLCPMAGVLSILLSLGGSIVPMEVTDYENIEAFQYQGMVPIADAPVASMAKYEGEHDDPNMTEADKFAKQVLSRARHPTGTRPTMKIGMGMMLQVCAITAILIACWFLETGAVIVWWCESWYWMYIWYIIVAFSSVLENFAGVPFTHTWTIRVWRAPRVKIDEDSPWVIKPTRDSMFGNFDVRGGQDEPLMSPRDIPRKPVAGGREYSRVIDPYTQDTINVSDGSSRDSMPHLQKRPTASDLQEKHFTEPVDVLTRLENGYSNMSAIWMDPTEPWSQSDDAFYVLLSVKGIDTSHATLRVISKVISIGVFAIGTALYASATLITILEAVTAATLILCAGIFGRVTAMWMVSTMMRNKPVLHRVVANRAEAGKYLDAVFRQPEIACEVKGHVILQGRCVKKFGNRIRWSNLFGVLTRPYNLTRMAVNGAAVRRETNQQTYGGFSSSV